jgi:hypothetical protein
MTRGVGRTSPYPAAVLGSVRVPSQRGGTVPGAGRCGAAALLAVARRRDGDVDGVTGAGCALTRDDGSGEL